MVFQLQPRGRGRGGGCDGWKEFDNAPSLVQLLVRKMYKVAAVGEAP